MAHREPVGPALSTMSRDVVLIAEDDDDLREALLLGLGAAGFRAVGASNGDTAARVLATAGLAAMIVGGNLRGVGGVELCRLARGTAAGRKMAIVLVAGHDDVDGVEAGLGAGVDRCLTGPVSPGGIVAALRQVIAGAYPSRRLRNAVAATLGERV